MSVVKGPKKRKKHSSPSDSSSDISEQDTAVHHAPYTLGKLKALHKKLDSSQLEPKIELKGQKENPQIVVDCGAATYEILKQRYESHVRNLGFNVSKKVTKDKAKYVVSFVLTVKEKKNSNVIYTVNFYNTTSKLLINRISLVDTFISHYQSLIESIPLSVISQLNENIQSSINSTLSSQYEPTMNDTDNIDIIAPNPSSTSTTSKEIEYSHASQQPAISANTTTEGCVLCRTQFTSIQALLQKVEKLEKLVENQSQLIRNMENNQLKIQQELTKTASHLDSRFNSLHQQLEQPNSTHTNTVLYSDQVKSIVNSKVQRPILKDNISPPPVDLRSSDKNKSIPPFKPDQSVVINISQTYATSNKFDQDNIRRIINKSYGPVIIEQIKPYHYNSDHPKLTLQMANVESAINLISVWKSDLFNGSTARHTINPKTINENTVMLKGVPIDADDNNIQQDIGNIFHGSSASRLLKDGKRLRTFKVKFANKQQFEKAVEEGILLPSQHIMCHCEPING